MEGDARARKRVGDAIEELDARHSDGVGTLDQDIEVGALREFDDERMVLMSVGEVSLAIEEVQNDSEFRERDIEEQVEAAADECWGFLG